MSAFYPLAYRQSWNRDAVVRALSEVAKTLGFVDSGAIEDFHESDTDQTISGFIREHMITVPDACKRLWAQKELLSEAYLRHVYYWASPPDRNITLVIADSNIIPFPAPTISTTGDLVFACGFIDFDITDRECARLNIDQHIQGLPFLYPLDTKTLI